MDFPDIHGKVLLDYALEQENSDAMMIFVTSGAKLTEGSPDG
jgi:hypothetical protein